jgi:hypothetical protein
MTKSPGNKDSSSINLCLMKYVNRFHRGEIRLFVLENNFVMLESSIYGGLLISDHLLLWLKFKLPFVFSSCLVLSVSRWIVGPHINPFLAWLREAVWIIKLNTPLSCIWFISIFQSILNSRHIKSSKSLSDNW